MGSGGGSAPAAPEMSAEEKALLTKQTQLIDQLGQVFGKSVQDSTQQQDLLKRISGLYEVNPEGQLTPNEAAIQRQADIAKMQLERYEKAIRGELPVSEGTLQRKAQEFGLLKENAARRGINISGDSLDNASSDSTAGAALLGQFKRSYGLLEDAERRGELAGGVNSGLSMLGASNAAGPANLIGAGGGLASAYGSAAQPYANQRMLEYQAAINQANYRNQGRLGAGNLIGTALGGGAGLLLSGGNPYMGYMGATLGGGAGAGFAGL